MTLFDAAETAVLRASIGLPGPERWWVVEAWLEVQALGMGEVVVTAQWKGDTIVSVCIDDARGLIAKVREALSTAFRFPSECRMPRLPLVVGPDDALPHPVQVRLPGRKTEAGRLHVRAMDLGNLVLEARLGADVATIYIAEGQRFAAFVERAIEEFEPDDDSLSGGAP